MPEETAIIQFRNTTKNDVMIPFLDPKHPRSAARHLCVKVGEDVELPEAVGRKFGFTPLSMFGIQSKNLKALADPADINKKIAAQKGRDKPKNPSKVQHGGEERRSSAPVPDEAASAEME